MSVINPFDFFVEAYAETFPFVYSDDLRADLAAYLTPEPTGPLVADFIASLPKGEQRTIPFLVELNAPPATARSAISSAWKPACRRRRRRCRSRRGSCRDSAWLLVQVARNLGLAARFVSGYLIQLKADVDPLEGPKGTDKDFCDLHAWTEIYIPGAGWIGFDVTSGLLCGEGHIPLSATPHYHSAAPITGTVDPANCEFAFRHAGGPHSRSAARHQAVLRRNLGEARRARRRGRSRSRGATTCGSPWAASRPSFRSTISKARNGIRRRSDRPSARSPTT